MLNDILDESWIPEAKSELHKTIEYKLNSKNYRSIEFDGTAEIMSLGCSFTFGLGLQNEMVWPSILAKKLNKSLVNLAQPGDSTTAQVRKAFSYFKEYGNPKIILAAFPLYRMEFPTIPGKLEIDIDNKKHNIEHFMFYDDYLEPYAKSPYDLSKIIPKEVAVFYTQYHIQMLEQYCESNDIKLIWSVWEDYENIYQFLIKNKPEALKNYCNINWERFFHIGSYKKKILECSEHEEDHDLFDLAGDRENGDFCHLGWHSHIHIAEDFYAQI